MHRRPWDGWSLQSILPRNLPVCDSCRRDADQQWFQGYYHSLFIRHLRSLSFLSRSLILRAHVRVRYTPEGAFPTSFRCLRGSNRPFRTTSQSTLLRSRPQCTIRQESPALYPICLRMGELARLRERSSAWSLNIDLIARTTSLQSPVVSSSCTVHPRPLLSWQPSFQP